MTGVGKKPPLPYVPHSCTCGICGRCKAHARAQRYREIKRLERYGIRLPEQREFIARRDADASKGAEAMRQRKAEARSKAEAVRQAKARSKAEAVEARRIERLFERREAQSAIQEQEAVKAADREWRKRRAALIASVNVEVPDTVFTIRDLASAAGVPPLYFYRLFPPDYF